MSVAVEAVGALRGGTSSLRNRVIEFSTRFEFQPLTAEPFAPEMEFHPGDGVAVSRAVMPALRLTNYGSSWPDPFFPGRARGPRVGARRWKAAERCD